jgi:hypothetical protein
LPGDGGRGEPHRPQKRLPGALPAPHWVQVTFIHQMISLCERRRAARARRWR